MRRWNGWGDVSVVRPIDNQTIEFLERKLGALKAPSDASLEQVLLDIPQSRIHARPEFITDTAERLHHGHGQSLADWIALRSGRIWAVPDAVVYPKRVEDLSQILLFAEQNSINVIPYGGGTSVVGHLTVSEKERPTLSVDLSLLNSLSCLDEESHLAWFGAGARGPQIEASLAEQGFTLGHFPQSFEYSTLGGWIATRSSGQQSLGYGRIESLFAGGTLYSPSGTVYFPPFPASAAGPDMRELCLGSEGRIGILGDAIVRVSRRPEEEVFTGIFFENFDSGMHCVRELVQSHSCFSMLRLSSPTETQTKLAMSSPDPASSFLGKLLRFRGLGDQKSLCIVGYGGDRRRVAQTRKKLLGVVRKHNGIFVGERMGQRWLKERFASPYLRNSLWDKGVAVDTLETAVPWSNVASLATAIESALSTALESIGEHVHAFTHLSQMYTTGSSIYVTYMFRIPQEWNELQRRWEVLKQAASTVIVSQGGTITHQHGIGLDHRAYLDAEKGTLVTAALRTMFRTFDPSGIMNPGKLVL